jgi:hypothetical protein
MKDLHMTEARRRPVTWMAVVYPEVAYVLDVYPEELARARRELRGAIRGEFASKEEAADAVVEAARRPAGRRH